MRALRLSLLTLVAGVLRRWLDVLTAQLAPATAAPELSQTPPDDRADTQPPAPPDHWVELVRQHAPQLLDSEAAGQPGVFEWRSDEAIRQVPTAAPAGRPRPLRLGTAGQRPAAAPPTVTSTHRRPLRMEPVVAPPLDAAPISVPLGENHTREVKPPLRTTQPAEAEKTNFASPNSEAISAPLAGNEARETQPPTRSTRLGHVPSVKLANPPDVPRVNVVKPDAPDAPVFPQRPPADAPAQPIRDVSSRYDDSAAVTAHFANAPFERQTIRETTTSLPQAADVPTIRTRSTGSAAPTQRRTGVPAAPTQLVLRPTITRPPLSVEDVSEDRWPSLPDEPAEETQNPAADRQRRERLKREQEGRTWSE